VPAFFGMHIAEAFLNPRVVMERTDMSQDVAQRETFRTKHPTDHGEIGGTRPDDLLPACVCESAQYSSIRRGSRCPKTWPPLFSSPLRPSPGIEGDPNYFRLYALRRRGA
jgi:hypothetical protein